MFMLIVRRRERRRFSEASSYPQDGFVQLSERNARATFFDRLKDSTSLLKQQSKEKWLNYNVMTSALNPSLLVFEADLL